MELPVNFRIAMFSEQTTGIMADRSADRVSCFAAALFAYRFFFRRFRIIVRLLSLPMIAAGLVLYACLDSYLAELLRFLASPNPRIATLALGVLAAGIFVRSEEHT